MIPLPEARPLLLPFTRETLIRKVRADQPSAQRLTASSTLAVSVY